MYYDYGMSIYKKRRVNFIVALIISALSLLFFKTDIHINQSTIDKNSNPHKHTKIQDDSSKNTYLKPDIIGDLNSLEVKGRAPKTNYSRGKFSMGWNLLDNGCNVREAILKRDLSNITFVKGCKVYSGVLDDPYTGNKIKFLRGENTSKAVQIDHVVALSNAWQTGAQNVSYKERNNLANDPLNLLAVDGPSNQQKGDGDAATWLPKNKQFRCSYILRQILVKKKYSLWVTEPEKKSMIRIMDSCPNKNKL